MYYISPYNLRTSFRPEWWYADTGALFLRIIYTLKSLLSVGWFRICTLNSDFRIGTYMNKSHNRIELYASLTRGDTRPASDVVKRIHKSASAKRERLLLLIYYTRRIKRWSYSNFFWNTVYKIIKLMIVNKGFIKRILKRWKSKKCSENIFLRGVHTSQLSKWHRK